VAGAIGRVVRPLAVPASPAFDATEKAIPHK